MEIDKKIIKRCQKGKREDQEKVYNFLSPTLYLICLRYANSTDEAKDILQDAFITIFNKINTFKFNGSFEGWAKKITINQALQLLRKRNILSESTDIQELKSTQPDVHISQDNTEIQYLLHLLNKLPERKKLIFNLYAIEGYSHKEIGTLLGITENSCSSLYHKAKTQLQTMYQEEEKNINV